jgi:hypothetical protein
LRHSASYLRYEFEIVTRTGSSNQFDLNALNAVASKQFANNSDFAVSEETVKKMSEVGSVEAFSLSHFHADSSVQDWDKKVVFDIYTIPICTFNASPLVDVSSRCHCTLMRLVS